MNRHLILKIVMAMACGVFLFVSACDSKKDEPPKKPQVVRKKISVPTGSIETKKQGERPAPKTTVKKDIGKKQAAPVALKSETSSVVASRGQQKPTSEGDEIRKKITLPANQVTPARKPVSSGKQISRPRPVKRLEPVKSQAGATIEPSPRKKSIALIAGITPSVKPPGEGQVYNPEGKIDPFAPLFKDEPAQRKEAAGKEKPDEKKKKRKRRTPIEKVDLSQLKLVGIILADSGNKALVEEASGKGYIIQKGTYIGIHYGKVIDILKDRVIVEEEHEDFLGNITMRKREMKLQKPYGEDYNEL